MSPLRPKFLFNILKRGSADSDLASLRQKRRHRKDQSLRIATILVAFGWSVVQGPANAGEVSWGSGAGTTPYPIGVGVGTDPVNDSFETDGIGSSGDTGVNLRFLLDDTTNGGTAQANRPQPGNTFSANYPNTAGSIPVIEGQGGQPNPNTPLTGGLTRGNILLGMDSDDLTDFQTFSVELYNDFGDLVPANNLTYTIIDLDRSCNRVDATDELLWQDVVATRALAGGAGGSVVTPTVTDGPATAGTTGVPGSANETVENITGNAAGSSLASNPGSLTFRGITDPTLDFVLDETTGNVNCNDNNSPNTTTADNDDNRDVEAANNITQGPAEGNVSLQTTGRLVDRVEFQFGNGAPLSTNNGLGTTSGFRFPGGTGNAAGSGVPTSFVNNLRADPAGHGVGVLGDFSFEPAVIGISETSTEPVFEGTGAQTGEWVVKYSLLVENSGEVDLTEVKVTNDLDATFGAGNYSVVPGSITIDGAVQPDGFTGSGANNMIQIPGTLAGSTDNDPSTPGDSRIVMFQVSFNAEDAETAIGQSFFSNQSTVEANPVDPDTGAASTIYTVRDRSSNGQEDPNTGGAVNALLDVDADVDDDDDGDGSNLGTTFANPFLDSNAAGATIDKTNFGTITRVDADNDTANNDSPTIVTVNPTPRIGVTKQVLDVTAVGGGEYDVTYRHYVCNESAGNGITLSDVQLTEDLDSTFRLGQPNGVTAYTVQSITSPAAAPEALPAGTTYQQLTVNTGFNGQGDQNLINPTGNTLNLTDCSVVDFVVRVTPGANTGDDIGGDPPYDGQVEAIGTGPAPGNEVVRDLSDDVTSTTFSTDVLLPIAEQLPRDTSNPANGTTNDPVDGAGTPQSNPRPAADPNSDTNENNQTPVTFLPPQIGVTKQVTGVTDNGDGTFTVSYRQIACNIGNEDISTVALSETETLATVFREGQANGVTSAQFVAGSLTSPTTAPDGFDATTYTPLSVNTNFDGSGDLQIATTTSLPAGNCSVVDYQVIINPTDPVDGTVQNLGDGTAGDPANDDPAYEAQVEVTGTGAFSNTPVSDLSDDVTSLDSPLPVAEQQPRDLNGNGTATDPVDGSGAPVSSPIPADPSNDETTDENNRTPISLVTNLTPEIGLTKQIVNVVDNGIGTDGRRSYDVTFEYRVCNTGDAALNGLTVSDDYDEQFRDNASGTVADYQVISVTPGASTASGPLVASPTAAGSVTGSNELLLASGDALTFAANTNPTATDGCTGDSAVVQTVVRVFEPNLSGVYDSSAIARGNSVSDSTVTVSDLSDDIPQFGTADPTNNVGTPGPGANASDPTDALNTPTLLQFSPLQLFKRITSVTRSGVTTSFNTVVGSVPDPSFVGEVDARSLGDLQTGDTVEYTIYYFNSSSTTFTALEICDAVPSPLTVTSVPGGTALGALVPRGSCINPETGEFDSGPQGAAVFTVGDVPASGTGSVSFTTEVQ